MSELIIPIGYGNCVLKWTYTGKTNPVTTTIGASTLVGASTPQEVVDAIWQDVADNSGLPCHASQMLPAWTFVGVEGVFNVAGTMVGAASAAAPVVGTHSAGATPTLNTSMIIQKKTTLIGRKFRGRMYWPCLQIDEGAIDPMGVISGGFFTAYSAIIAAMEGAILADADWAPYILHTDSTPPTAITSLPLQSHVVTQRRRMRN